MKFEVIMDGTSSLNRNALFLIALIAGLVFVSIVQGQVTPEEHAAHHPEQAQDQQKPADEAQDSGMGEGGMMGGGESEMGGGEGGMGGMMGGMMEKMGAPVPKEMYPKLMDFPYMTAEQRSQFQEEAHARMIAGTVLLSEGLDRLTIAAPTDDFAAMQEATAKMREGLAQFESGLAAHRAIAEGKSPRNVATQWFKREMNLIPPATTASTSFSLFGMSLFHTLVMLLLVLFTVAMLWMYFFKMRRASSLLEQLTMESGSTAGADLARTATADGNSATSAIVKKSPTALTSTADETKKACCDDPAMPCEEDCGDACGGATDEGGTGDFSQGLLAVARRKLCKLRVAKIYQETGDVKTFRLVACHGGSIPFSYLPGQFLTLKLPTGDKPIRRSYTIASSPTQGYFCEITVKREGKGAGSRYLHDSVTEGMTLEVQAPSGKFVFTGKEADDIVLIAGGVGITPMMSITRALTDMGWTGQIYFIAACRDAKHFIFETELKQLQKRHANLHVHAALSQAKKVSKSDAVGRINKDLLARWVPDIIAKRVHICGPVPMMEAMKTTLMEMGSSRENIFTENFGSQAKPKNKSNDKPKSNDQPKSTIADTGDKTTKKSSAQVAFQTSGKSTAIAADETVLEAAERVGVDIDNSCRVGSCGMCTIPLVSGKVTMEVDDGLEPEDKAAGKILACQALCDQDIVVDA